jgi:plastocyanin
MRRRLPLLLLPFLIALPACGGGGSGSGEETRTVLVDYNHDEVAASFLGMYPRNVNVHPGDTVVFKQAWTGEPHTVTMGTLFNDVPAGVPELLKWIKEGGPDPFENLSPETQSAVEEKFNKLPFALGESYEASQNAAQPCFLDTGAPPEDPDTPCPKRSQPAFNGRQSYYSSGIIPYEGNQGNRFEVPLSADIDPGDYLYYCAVHGPGQSGVITVKPASEDIPSQSAVDREARKEIEAVADPLLKSYDEAKAGKLVVEELNVKPPLSGFFPDDPNVNAFGSEFVPRELKAKVGQPVTWTVVGGHTISFDVPRYLPILTFADDGKVTLNPRVALPQGGWPGQAEEGGEEEAAPEEGAPPEEQGAPPEGEGGEEEGPLELETLDAGEWNGSGFVSSGVVGMVKYLVTFTKPGTYKYACLIHPRMVGEVVVS